MNVLGLKIRGHDPGAALIADGRIVAISEERLSRVKHSFEMFPERSIRYCLDALGVKSEDIELVILEQVSRRWEVRMKEIFLARAGKQFPRARIEVINHHDAHAASAFFCSPYDEAAVLVYDGAGEVYRTHMGVSAIETETMYRGAGNRLYELNKTLHARDGKSNPYTQGIGKLYSELTSYLELGKYNEGKTMGLAPYGTDAILKMFPVERWLAEKDGVLVCNARIVYPRRSFDERVKKRKSVRDFFTVAYHFFRMRIKRRLRPLLFHALRRLYGSDMIAEPVVFSEIRLPRPPRGPADKLPDDYYASVAYAVQKVFEEFACRIGKKIKDMTGAENLCVAGGCGLNIDANKNFFDRVGFKSVFIQPAASDAGIPLGCALWGWHMVLDQPRFWEMRNVALGRPYAEREILAALDRRQGEIVVKKSQDVAYDTAALMADGKIIGWFQGGSEYGPRALGHRSIVCDARPPDMKDVVNEKVKHRELWRPFAASILREYMREWFELESESPFMLLAARVAADKRGKIPSVTHVDNTTRIQSLTPDANGRYYNLVAAFHKMTGTPLILNTSFNLGGDPIVETPDEALDCFLKTAMDHVVLEDYIISKSASRDLLL